MYPDRRGASFPARPGAVVALALLLTAGPNALAASSRAAPAPPSRGSGAPDVAALGPATAPTAFVEAAEQFGAGVGEARAAGAPASVFESWIETGGDLLARLEAARARLEERAGEDDRALEQLYRSEAWQRLGYAEVLIRYWDGWAQVGLGEGLPPGEARRAALEAALAAFSRAAVELALPAVALRSQLGLAVTLRELGRAERAREILERLEVHLDRETDARTRAAVRYELALLDLEAGRIEAARARVEALPPDAVDGRRRRALEQRVARAWLTRAAEHPEQPEAAREAARTLRELYAAGGEARRFAASEILRHRDLLVPFDTGPLGALLRAEEAFDEGRFEEARSEYARALGAGTPLVGVDPDVARYRYAVALSRSPGGREEALRGLEDLVAAGGGGAARQEAIALAYGLAEAQAREAPDPATEERARRAARRLLASDPEAPAADSARYRLARSAGTRSAPEAVRLLEAIAPGSDAYTAALLERIRLRAGELLPGRERPADPAAARRLLDDLAEVERLQGAGRLPPDAERAQRFRVLRALAARSAGEPPEAVLAAVETARAGASLDPGSRGALRRVELAALREGGRIATLLERFAAAPNDEIRADWAIWDEAFLALRSAREPGAAALLPMAERLAELAPGRYRADAGLAYAELLLASGRAGEAARRARGLVDADPTWANARFLLARALDAGSDAGAARAAWEEVAHGLEPGASGWLEAELGVVAALRREGDAVSACARLRVIDPQILEGAPRRLRDRYRHERSACPRG